MKKYSIFAFALVLTAMSLVGCRSNVGPMDSTTIPTTQATTAPTTVPTTIPAVTEPANTPSSLPTDDRPEATNSMTDATEGTSAGDQSRHVPRRG